PGAGRAAGRRDEDEAADRGRQGTGQEVRRAGRTAAQSEGEGDLRHPGPEGRCETALAAGLVTGAAQGLRWPDRPGGTRNLRGAECGCEKGGGRMGGAGEGGPGSAE